LTAQFSIGPIRLEKQSRQESWVVILQHDSVSALATRIVAPLLAEPQIKRVARLHPVLRLEGREMILAVDQAAAVPVSRLGDAVGSAEHLCYKIVAALDLLITGV
jgi:hypothetical protein